MASDGEVPRLVADVLYPPMDSSAPQISRVSTAKVMTAITGALAMTPTKQVVLYQPCTPFRSLPFLTAGIATSPGETSPAFATAASSQSLPQWPLQSVLSNSKSTSSLQKSVEKEQMRLCLVNLFTHATAHVLTSYCCARDHARADCRLARRTAVWITRHAAGVAHDLLN